jgi:hypothetical protein
MNKKIVIGIVISLLVVILAGGLFAGWWFFYRVVPTGQACRVNQKCSDNGQCISGTCSVGTVGSNCGVKEDCKTAFCTNGKCSEGIAGSTCLNYKDCIEGLLCKSKVCAVKPSYVKYFDRIDIGWMNPGSPPSTNNPIIPGTTIKAGKTVEVDILNNKKTTGTFWVEMINQETGETAWTTDKQTISGTQGTGFQFNEVGNFDLNVYFNNELVYSVTVTMN